jgi:hypothetical protein
MSVTYRWMTPVCAALMALSGTATGCGGDSRGANRSVSTSTGAGAGIGGLGAAATGGTAGAIGAGTGGADGGAAGDPSGGTTGVIGCAGSPVTTQKRLVQLTDNQLVNAYTALFADAAPAMFMGEEIGPANARSFPPLSTIGTTINESAWALRRRAAERARTHILANLDSRTPCGATPTDPECGLDAVLAFAEKAYRRPLDPKETTSYQTLWAEITTTPGIGLADAIAHGYSAVLVAPGFLFRTETGGDFTTEGTITPYELASELSHFLTDGPPDAELLAAAAEGELDQDGVRAHARRILEGQVARDNLEAAMVSYFRLSNVTGVVLDATTIPGFDFTLGVRNSMYREAQEFLKNTLWQGTLGDLISSRRTWINGALAPIYGVTVPSDDVNVFSEVTLPADRAGLLTLSPFLTSMSRPTGTSVVTRGLSMSSFACFMLPLFPEDLTIDTTRPEFSGDWSEKRKADYRAQDPRCNDCHKLFDAMGLAIENYDAIGRYRTQDPSGRPIDLAWTTGTMPEAFDYDQDGDGVPDPTVTNSAVTLAEALLRDRAAWGGSSVFTRCMAMNLINYALADESHGSARGREGDIANSCAVRSVTDQFVTATDRSFTSLLVEIAASETLRVRKPGM